MEYFCRHIHRDLTKEFNYALVWGMSAKHMPQRCGLSQKLADEDVVQIVKKKVIDDGKGRFKAGAADYVKIADREKKKPLKT